MTDGACLVGPDLLIETPDVLIQSEPAFASGGGGRSVRPVPIQEIMRAEHVPPAKPIDLCRRVAEYRSTSAEAESWAAGYGILHHCVETQARVFRLAELFAERDVEAPLFTILSAADRVNCAATWIAVNAALARRAHLDGGPLHAPELRLRSPWEGDWSRSLLPIPAYVGYLAANAISGITRGWALRPEAGRTGLDAVDLILGNFDPDLAQRYSLTSEGLARFLEDHRPASDRESGNQPRGKPSSTAPKRSLSEADSLKAFRLRDVAQPTAGERLVLALTEKRFETEAAKNWDTGWWRPGEHGVITPILFHMTPLASEEGSGAARCQAAEHLVQGLRKNGFDPLIFDGVDPAAFVWAIFEMEFRLEAAVEKVRSGDTKYPIPFPIGLAIIPQEQRGDSSQIGELDLPARIANPPKALHAVNETLRRLWVPLTDLTESAKRLANHDFLGRPRENDHPLTVRNRAVRR